MGDVLAIISVIALIITAIAAYEINHNVRIVRNQLKKQIDQNHEIVQLLKKNQGPDSKAE